MMVMNGVPTEVYTPPPHPHEGQSYYPFRQDPAVGYTAQGPVEAAVELSHNPVAHQRSFEGHEGGSERGQKTGGGGSEAGSLTIFSGEDVNLVHLSLTL